MFAAGFNHFWHAENENHGGDCLYIQGHVSPGIYARAYLEGRISEEQLLNFRQEVDGKGLSSYPHPKLMPDFWQFPTVSMGLGPLMAIYQARFLKYLHARGIANTENRKVWVFCGDGEMDEPESLGAIGLAARENLDNLVFVINCNLQRLDGPVRGNGKIIQELEGEFRGAGWNVIKLLWGKGWDELLAKDKDGVLKKIMMETTATTRPSRPTTAPTCASTSSAAIPRPEDGRAHVRRRDLEPAPRRPRSAEGLRRLPPPTAQGPAHRAAGQDRQGLRHGQGR
jgi:pyruvate dehydrogenase E1 component